MFWWTYFDFLGGRLPRDNTTGLSQLMISHLPVTAAIAASGAAILSIVEHADADRVAADGAWLLAGSMALAFLTLVVTMQALADYRAAPEVDRPITYALVLGSAVALIAGSLRPPPWLLVLVTAIIPSAIWFFAIDRRMQRLKPGETLHIS